MWNDWTKWERVFLWTPTKINGRWIWFKFIYKRQRILLWYSQKTEYDYALDLFDLIHKSK